MAPPAGVSNGITRTTLSRSPIDFWKWLAVLGGMGLLVNGCSLQDNSAHSGFANELQASRRRAGTTGAGDKVMIGHPLALLLLIFPAVWAVYEWPRTNRKLSLSLKALSLAAIIGALSEPVITLPGRKPVLRSWSTPPRACLMRILLARMLW